MLGAREARPGPTILGRREGVAVGSITEGGVSEADSEDEVDDEEFETAASTKGGSAEKSNPSLSSVENKSLEPT